MTDCAYDWSFRINNKPIWLQRVSVSDLVNIYCSKAVVLLHLHSPVCLHCSDTQHNQPHWWEIYGIHYLRQDTPAFRVSSQRKGYTLDRGEHLKNGQNGCYWSYLHFMEVYNQSGHFWLRRCSSFRGRSSQMGQTVMLTITAWRNDWHGPSAWRCVSLWAC